jgi:putative tricarboxylic transport membrane protein
LAPRLRQVVPHAVMLLGAGLLFWASTRIDVDTGGRIGPAVWPRTIILLLALLCLYEIVKRLLAGTQTSATGVVSTMAMPGEASAEEREVEHPRKLMGGIALVAAYVFGVQWLGFFVATALFLAVFPWVGGMRRPLLSASIAVLGSLALIIVFMRVAYISLPLGAGPFRELSILLLRVLGVT